MIKKVAILNGNIEHVYHNEEELNQLIFDGSEIEELEMEYDELNGWVKKYDLPKMSDKERISELEKMINLILTGGI